jgi:hypothetical protein
MAMTLDAAIRAFARKNYNYSTPGEALGRCENIARKFVEFLDDHEVPTPAAPQVRVFLKQDGFEGYPIPISKICNVRDGKHCAKPITCEHHHVVQIGGRFIDFAVRAHAPRAPFPLVWEKVT